MLAALAALAGLAAEAASMGLVRDKGGSVSAPGELSQMAGPQRKIVIELPRAPRPDEVVGISVTTGPLPLGTEIRFSTLDGTDIGSAAGFPGTGRSDGLVFQLAVSGSAFNGKRLELMATMIEPSTATVRSPTADELRSVTATIQGGG